MVFVRSVFFKSTFVDASNVQELYQILELPSEESKLYKNGKKINEILPMYQIENGTIRTLSTNVPENTSSRIPVEDRAPSEVGYDNPVMNMNP